MALDELPRSFQDLFAVARELKVRCVWVDSLCIVQDDPEDLAREIGTMGEVYGQAYLTVAFAVETPSSGGILSRNHNQPVFTVPFAASTGHPAMGSYSFLRFQPGCGFATDVEDSKSLGLL